MARKTSDATAQKMSESLIAQGIEPTFDVGDAVKWAKYTDAERELSISVTNLPVRFVAGKGGKWVASFPMLQTQNQSEMKVSTRGYVTEAAGGADFKSAWDHVTIALGRQLCGIAELRMTSTDVPADVASLKNENAALKDRDVVATVLEFVYMGDTTKITEITPELWARVPEAMQEKIGREKPEYVPATPEDDAVAEEVVAAEPVAAGKKK